MASHKKKDIISELESFLQELNDYQYYRLLQATDEATEKQMVYAGNLRDKLQRDAGRFRPLIAELTGKEHITLTRKGQDVSFDMWFKSLSFEFDLATNEALGYCADVTRQAIGKLESDIQMGIRDKQGRLIEKPQEFSSESPKAFISHGKESVALRKLKEFLETLDIEPLIVKKQASLDKDLPDKVNLYLSQADFVIILATGDDQFEGKRHPRQNVIHEIGLAQKTHPGRIIYLLEEGAEFPSNIRPKVWESFKQRNMMDAFLGIVRELRAYGILKVTKSAIEENSS